MNAFSSDFQHENIRLPIDNTQGGAYNLLIHSEDMLAIISHSSYRIIKKGEFRFSNLSNFDSQAVRFKSFLT